MFLDPFQLMTIIFFILFLVFLFFYLKQKSISKNLGDLLHEKEMQYALLQSQYNSQKESFDEKIQILQDAKNQLSLEFKNLANQIFEHKTKEFSTASKEQLELLLKPFREQINNFSKESKEQFETELKERYLLRDELKRLKELNEQLSCDAINLTNALKGENKTQGNWGEMILANLLEESGLKEGIEYELQSTLKSDDGKSYRPDVIIHMPQNRDIVIDSKVSLTAYERFANSDDEDDKKRALKEHINSVYTHIKELSTKRYEKLQGINTVDFVLLFMPIEGAFFVALQNDNELFKKAYEQNVILVSSLTLLVTLRTIEHIWRIQRQEENTKKIVAEAEAMYDKFVLFVEEMQNLGNSLHRAQDSYTTAMGRLSIGRGNLLRRAANLKELGLKPKKELPQI